MEEQSSTQFIAYYRVSTQKQGSSGLGLEAQKREVMEYMRGQSLLAEYEEIESGKKHNNRPELLKAIEHCKKTGSKLVIAKLDRLSRNVSFIAKLLESKVKFVCCDMPEADNFTIHIFAAMAEKEREMISARTKAALRSAKNRGVILGNPQLFDQRKQSHMNKMRSARKPVEYDEKMLFIVNNLTNVSMGHVANELNKLGFKTSRGCQFTATHVFRLRNTSKTVT